MSNGPLQIDDVWLSHEEATETLRALRAGQVDGVVVNGPRGHGVVLLREPDHAYRALVEAMSEGAALVTCDGIICYHNSRFAELTVGAAPLHGRPLRELVGADAAGSIDALLERARLGPTRIEVGLGAPDGRSLPVQLTATLAAISDIPVLCVVITDLSDQRLQAELYRDAQLRLATRERLIAIAGHELRAPLQALVFELDVLLASQRSPDPGPASAATTIGQLESIHRQALYLANLMGSLLDVGLVGSGQLRLTLEPLDLAEVVRAVVARSDALAHSRSPITLDLHPICGRWDRVRLEQVATNLLSNAGKYGLGQPIRVVVEGDHEVARLVVEDRGVGIPRDAVDRLFRPFERIGSVESATGLGLGLYITAQIVKAHGGAVRVDSEPGGGSRFVVELPRG